MARWQYALILLAVPGLAPALDVDRVDPPSWWVGMREPAVQLLVYGAGVADARVHTDHPAVAVRATHRTTSDSHLFVDLAIALSAAPGPVPLRFTVGDETVTWTFPLAAREAGSAERKGFDASDVIYLVMPDRFANGDPTNDTVAGLADGLDRDDPYGRHGGDLQGIIDHLDYIATMGFTQLWLNPVLTNDQPMSSYHGYAITDFYEVDPRLGSNARYRELVRKAGAYGIEVIQDIVLNHAGSGHRWLDEPPADDWFNRQGLPFAVTSHRREVLLDPHAAQADLRAFQDGWFVATMPDLNQRNPYLATYLVQHAIWWIEYAGLTGLRVDTWPYSYKPFLSDWTARILAEYPRLSIVGEEWTSEIAHIAYWQAGAPRHDGYRSLLPSLIDFPLRVALVDALTEAEAWDAGLVRLYATLAQDFHYGDPMALVILADNHDMSRIYTQLGEDPARWRIAMTLLATLRGIPQVFYGTEILMANPGTDSHGVIRSDFPGGWGEAAPNAFTGAGLSPAAAEAQRFLRALLTWRRSASAVHRGALTHYLPRDGHYVFFRHDGEQGLLVAVNRDDEPVRLGIERFAESIGAATHARDVLSGQRFALAEGLPLAPVSATIFELE